jgi:hypothetical protein
MVFTILMYAALIGLALPTIFLIGSIFYAVGWGAWFLWHSILFKIEEVKNQKFL